MRSTGKARRDYLRNGFAVVEGVFSAAECAVLRGEITRLKNTVDEQQWGDIVRVGAMAARQRPGVTRTAAGDAIFMLGDLARYSVPLCRAVADRQVAALVSAVLGHPRPCYHFSNITQKPPGVGPRVGSHRDINNRLVTMSVSRFCRIAICLDGMSPANGGMQFCAGSHRIADARVRALPRRKLRPRSPAKAVRCGTGAVVIFSPKVIHSSLPNRSRNPRRNLVAQYGAPYQRLIASRLEPWTGRPVADLR